MYETRSSSLALALLGSAALLSGCGSTAAPTDAGGDAPACTPDEATFDAEVAPHIANYCGTCHGETPDFGAPISLLHYDALMQQRTDGTRLVDHVATRLANGSMPPIGMPRLPNADADAIAAWASCGAVDVPEGTGVVSSAPPFLAPGTAPPGLTALDLLADEYEVGPDVRDDYRCFVFDADITEDRFVRRFEMVFDESRVLHHVVLLRDADRVTTPGDFDCYDGGGMPAGSQYLYAWAPGQSALQFPEGGLRITPGERFIVQVHYNNGASIPDVRDSSGVRLFLGPAEGTEYGMIALGPTNFALPPRMRSEASSRCTFAEPATILAGMPHMHLLGSEFEQTITHEGSRQPLVRLSGWSFDTQLFYSLPTEVQRGDVIETTCTFQNPHDEEVSAGEDTSDEMCFDFMYVTPPPADRYCDQGSEDHPTDVSYLGGACLPAGAPTDAPLVTGHWTMADAPPALVQASVPDGRWVLDSIEFFVTSAHTPIGNIDLDATYVLGRGQVVIEDGQLTYDLAQDTVVLTDSGIRFGGPGANSFAGAFDDEGGSPATMPLSCPTGGGDATFDWGYDGETLTIGFESSDVPSQTLWPRFSFRHE